jgi:hypothetical protein
MIIQSLYPLIIICAKGENSSILVINAMKMTQMPDGRKQQDSRRCDLRAEYQRIADCQGL